MTKLIRTTTDSQGRERVVFVHHKPERLSEEARQSGYMIEEIPPEPVAEARKTNILCRDEKGELYWITENRPATQEEAIADLIEVVERLVKKLEARE